MTPSGKGPCDAPFALAAPNASACTPAAAPWILAATILASSMVFIDGTVVNVALPVLQQDLSASLADVQWVVESYALFLAALLLVGGTAGDRFGRRRIFAAGVAVFAAASLGCGIAGNVEELIVARAVQGVGGALLVPGSLAIIGASFDERRRGRAIGTWSGATAITAAIGPVLGGWMIGQFSWRAAFLINLPLAAVVVALTLWRVPESSNRDAKGSLDWQGAALATLGLGGLVYGLIGSSARGWEDPAVMISLVLGAMALAGFGAVEATKASPMLPMELFRSRTFCAANLLTLLLYGALGGGLFFFPLNLIQVQGYSAAAAGATLLPFVVLMSVLSRWAGGLVGRYGAKRPLVAGPTTAAVGFVLFALPSKGGSYWATFFPAVVVLGLGMTVTVAPLTTTVMNAVDAKFAGAASGINNAASRVSALIAIALLGIVFAHVFNRSLDVRLERIALPPAVLEAIQFQRGKLAAIEPPKNISPADNVAVRRAIAESFISGFRGVMIVSALLAVAAAASACILIEGHVVSSKNPLAP